MVNNTATVTKLQQESTVLASMLCSVVPEQQKKQVIAPYNLK